MFYDVHKENMFRTNLEDGREAPSKASILYYLKNIALPGSKVFSTQNIDHSTQINIAFSQNLRQIGQQTNRPYIFISYSRRYLQSLCMIKKWDIRIIIICRCRYLIMFILFLFFSIILPILFYCFSLPTPLPPPRYCQYCLKYSSFAVNYTFNRSSVFLRS